MQCLQTGIDPKQLLCSIILLFNYSTPKSNDCSYNYNACGTLKKIGEGGRPTVSAE